MMTFVATRRAAGGSVGIGPGLNWRARVPASAQWATMPAARAGPAPRLVLRALEGRQCRRARRCRAAGGGAPLRLGRGQQAAVHEHPFLRVPDERLRLPEHVEDPLRLDHIDDFLWPGDAGEQPGSSCVGDHARLMYLRILTNHVIRATH